LAGRSGKKIIAAVEDVRLAIEEDGFYDAVQELIDVMDDILDEELRKIVRKHSSTR